MRGFRLLSSLSDPREKRFSLVASPFLASVAADTEASSRTRERNLLVPRVGAAALRYRNRPKITVFVSGQKPYPALTPSGMV